MVGDVSDTAAVAAATAAESLPNSKLSSDGLLSIGCANEIRSVSLAFVRFEFRGVLDGGGANEPLLDDVGNFDFPLLLLLLLPPPYDDVDAVALELPNEPGRGR